MHAIKRLKLITLSLGIIGFIPALFLWGQTEGLGMDTDKQKALHSISVVIVEGTNTFDEMALIYCLISACFFLFIVLLLIRNNIYLKVASLFPLVFIVTQCRLLIIEKAEIFKSKWDYSNWLGITYNIDFGFLALTVALLILQLYSIWLVYHSSPAGDPNMA